MGEISEHYTVPADFLQQGDIFRSTLVLPIADFQERIFRTVDGRHGSTVFEAGSSARVFAESDLVQTLSAQTSPTPDHTNPFHQTQDGQEELVVVFAQRTHYFVVGSQTCDISGQDGPADPVCIVFPIRTLMELCSAVRLPFPDATGGPLVESHTIQEYLVLNAGGELLLECKDSEYYWVLQGILEQWTPTQKSVQGKCKSVIRKYVNDEIVSGSLYWLKEDMNIGVPACCVDLTRPQFVPTSKLIDRMKHRIATVKTPYREQFSSAVGNRISRVATDDRIAPGKL